MTARLSRVEQAPLPRNSRSIECDNWMRKGSQVSREIERKFLVANNDWRILADNGRRLRQAYLADTDRAAVRVRIINDDRAVLTIKSAEAGLSRQEFEYALPKADAEALIELRQGSILDKTRFHLRHSGHIWEVDVYGGDNAGLVIAEIELASEDAAIELPPWLGDEVTGERRYYAARLAVRPFRSWPEGREDRQ
jgi:adenylate cyclase